MASVSGQASDERVSIYDYIVARLIEDVVIHWESLPPAQSIDPAVLDRAPDLLHVIGQSIDINELQRIQQAIQEGNGRALACLINLDHAISDTCNDLLTQCERSGREKAWSPTRDCATLAIEFAAAAGRDKQTVLAYVYLAIACRSLKDNAGAIDAYKACIKIALQTQQARDDHLLSVAYDNLGLALQDTGMYDEALDCFKKACVLEQDLNGQIDIQNNRALVLLELGELRAATVVYQDLIKQLEQSGANQRRLAVALDNAAAALAKTGGFQTAMEMFDRAHPLFAADDLDAQVRNALGRSTVLDGLGKTKEAGQAFVEAHDLAFEFARQQIDVEHYRQGFLHSRQTSLPAGSPEYRLFVQGVVAKATDSRQALALLDQAAQMAQKAGDMALTLRCMNNKAAVLFEVGRFEEAYQLATQVRNVASKLGLARCEYMAVGTLASLSAAGIDAHSPLGPLGDLAVSATLLSVHAQIVKDAHLSPAEELSETYDPGANANELAMMSAKHHAVKRAIQYYLQALDRAHHLGDTPDILILLANRLAGLRSAYALDGNTQETEQVAAQVAALLGKDNLPEKARLVAHWSLGNHFAESDAKVAISHLQQASAILEAMRQRLTPGIERTDVGRQLQGLPHLLARLLREQGDDKGSYEALQAEKSRRLIDALAALSPAKLPVNDALPKLDEVMQLVRDLDSSHSTILVDLAVENGMASAYLVAQDRLQVVHVTGDTSGLEAQEWGDVREREKNRAQLCQSNTLLLKLAEEISLATPVGSRLLLVPDRGLQNLPLHSIPVNGCPWCDHFPIGYLAAAGELRFTHTHQPLVGRSLVAGDSAENLPNAACECAEVASLLSTRALTGLACTRTAIENALQVGKLDVVHLAVHGRGDEDRGGRASLLMADGKGGTEWVAFDELAAFPWQAELVVFSGCSTGVAGPRQGFELAGVARAAAERGAAAVIACLWPVGDAEARVFMNAFYQDLVKRRAVGPVDLRLVLDQARKDLRAWLAGAMPAVKVSQRRDGRSIRSSGVDDADAVDTNPAAMDVMAWAPFILLGDPILGN